MYQQAFMVDLGYVQVDNHVMTREEDVAVEMYGIALSKFKASRYMCMCTYVVPYSLLPETHLAM